MKRFYITAKKENGKLIFQNFDGYETRNQSVIWCIEKADEVYKWKDFSQIEIETHDCNMPDNLYTFTKNASLDKLVPDFNFHAWPEVGIVDYAQTIKEIDVTGSTPAEKMKVGWIGNISTSNVRGEMLRISKNYPELFDIMSMTWSRPKSSEIKLIPTQYMSLCDLVKKYAILIDVEGTGYSGRLKHLLWSHRPVLLVQRPYTEFFDEYLKAWEHYIPVKRDLSDLVEKTKWCIDNYPEACKISERAYQFSNKYLTRDACYEQWNKTIEPFIQK